MQKIKIRRGSSLDETSQPKLIKHMKMNKNRSGNRVDATEDGNLISLPNVNIVILFCWANSIVSVSRLFYFYTAVKLSFCLLFFLFFGE